MSISSYSATGYLYSSNILPKNEHISKEINSLPIIQSLISFILRETNINILSIRNKNIIKKFLSSVCVSI